MVLTAARIQDVSRAMNRGVLRIYSSSDGSLEGAVLGIAAPRRSASRPAHGRLGASVALLVDLVDEGVRIFSACRHACGPAGTVSVRQFYGIARHVSHHELKVFNCPSL